MTPSAVSAAMGCRCAEIPGVVCSAIASQTLSGYQFPKYRGSAGNRVRRSRHPRGVTTAKSALVGLSRAWSSKCGLPNLLVTACFAMPHSKGFGRTKEPGKCDLKSRGRCRRPASLLPRNRCGASWRSARGQAAQRVGGYCCSSDMSNILDANRLPR